MNERKRYCGNVFGTGNVLGLQEMGRQDEHRDASGSEPHSRIGVRAGFGKTFRFLSSGSSGIPGPPPPPSSSLKFAEKPFGVRLANMSFWMRFCNDIGDSTCTTLPGPESKLSSRSISAVSEAQPTSSTFFGP